jgi:hypothetical protein
VIAKPEIVNVDGKELEGYRIAVSQSNDVPKFGPPLPNPPVFTEMNKLHDFLMAKCTTPLI